MRRYVLVAVAAVIGLGVVQADEVSFPKRMPADIPGSPTLGAPFLVMAGDGPVLTGKHGLAAPALWDFNGDCYRDMITGQYHPGEVTWFRGSPAGFMPGKTLSQEGNPDSHGQPSWRDYDGEEGDIGTFDYWAYTSATFGDLDDDGDYDLIVGGSGGLRVSENVGGRKNPSFAQRVRVLDVEGRALTCCRPKTAPRRYPAAANAFTWMTGTVTE